jgi:hypothetical protein
MPEQFDPSWEYFVGDPEIEEILQESAHYLRSIDQFIDYRHNEGKTLLEGIRIGKGNPNHLPRFKFGKEKKERAYIKNVIVYSICLKCGISFQRKRNTKGLYCSRSCNPGADKIIPSLRKCRRSECRKRFHPARMEHYFCSRLCSSKNKSYTCRRNNLLRCTVCSRQVDYKRAYVNRKEHLYCSNKCKKKRDNLLWWAKTKGIKSDCQIKRNEAIRRLRLFLPSGELVKYGIVNDNQTI